MEDKKVLQKKSMRDTAYELMLKKKKPMTFEKLWNEVSEILGLSPEAKTTKISDFYTQITLDGRFIFLEENTWDLKARHTFDKISIDMNDIYADIDDEEIELEDDTFVGDEIDRLVAEEEKDDDEEEEVIPLVVEEEEEY